MNVQQKPSQEKSCRVLLVRDGKNDADWLRARQQNGVGASESPIICGLSGYGSIVKTYGEKLGLIDPVDETEPMRWGKLLEPIILAEYRERTGREVFPAKVLLQSIAHPFMLATPDGEQAAPDHFGPGIVQIKLTRFASDWEEEVPVRVWAQMQHEMAVTGHTWGTAVALVGGTKLAWGDVVRDDNWIANTLIPRCADFWRRVTERLPIPTEWVDDSDDTLAAIRALYPEKMPETTVDLPGEFFEVDEQLRAAEEAKDEAQARVTTLKSRIKLAIGNASFGRLGDGTTFSYKTHTRATYDVPAHIKAQWVRHSEVRPLRRLKKGAK